MQNNPLITPHTNTQPVKRTVKIMPNSTHDIIIKFSQQVKKILGSKLDKVFYTAPMLVEIITNIRM